MASNLRTHKRPPMRELVYEFGLRTKRFFTEPRDLRLARSVIAGMKKEGIIEKPENLLRENEQQKAARKMVKSLHGKIAKAHKAEWSVVFFASAPASALLAYTGVALERVTSEHLVHEEPIPQKMYGALDPKVTVVSPEQITSQTGYTLASETVRNVAMPVRGLWVLDPATGKFTQYTTLSKPSAVQPMIVGYENTPGQVDNVPDYGPQNAIVVTDPTNASQQFILARPGAEIHLAAYGANGQITVAPEGQLPAVAPQSGAWHEIGSYTINVPQAGKISAGIFETVEQTIYSIAYPIRIAIAIAIPPAAVAVFELYKWHLRSCIRLLENERRFERFVTKIVNEQKG